MSMEHVGRRPFHRGVSGNAPEPAQPIAGNADPSAAEPPPPVFTPIAKIDRVTLRNGLIIEEMRHGQGELCLPGTVVKVRYSCRVEGGEVFDSTGDEAQEYALEKMIKGWQDGLPGMLVGGVRRLTVPPELGYGTQALKDGDGIVLAPANSTLIYEIELLGVR